MLVEANGLAINCEIDGLSAPFAGDEPAICEPMTVMLSHSLATNLGIWRPQMPALSGRYRVLRYDIRGHGRSEVPEGLYILESLVEDARSLLLALGVVRTHFVGISLGGMIGQLLAATYPDMLAGLVICDTACRTEPQARTLWDERIAVAEALGMEPHVEPTIARWFTPGFVVAHPEVVDPVRMMIRKTDPRGYVGCAHAVKTLDIENRLQSIRVPTLVVVGEDDPGAPVEMARAIKEAITGAELAVLPSASHLSNLEQPEVFNRTVMDFLGRVDRERAT